jgi:drug/metabolite transporter (DMT)-like permease
MKWHLLFPLLSSLLYVAGALFLKRAQQLGAGVARTTFLSNLTSALLFTLLLPMGGTPQPWTLLWQPGIVALLFVGAQAFAVTSISRGDVSVATPVLGAKTVFVAWFTTVLLATALSWQLWTAAAMSFAAIVLLNLPLRSSGARKPLGATVTFSLLAAASYALFDVLVQKWSPQWGAGRFLPIMFGISAVLTLGFVPFFRAPLSALPRAAWPSLGAGAFFTSLQSLVLVTAIAVYGEATSINVVYSARGIWSVLAVWLIGHWFANEEGKLGGAVLGWRLAGAVLMTAAIVLVVTA